MTVLCDKDIMARWEELFPFTNSLLAVFQKRVQPASVDLRLGVELKRINGETIQFNEEGYLLKPGEFILGSTIEYLTIPDDIVARVEGRSSIGRLGVMVHITAGYIDPGFEGNITLELFNCSDKPFKLCYGDCLCQIVFETLSSPCECPYNGKYQGDTGVVCSRWNK
ncbi:dCTP deaminase [uncultured Methanobrevibacter sp.]|uniref:dCTP deaminase n=1 Tax=uncultured Methanobrevibacter sp. TaxID=253161 RepID=UPI002639FD41|nr:dCTP deaminase [uncultured Methanobrevibacter sp.]